MDSSDKPSSIDLKSIERPAILFCNAFGDHLLTRPSILAMSKIFSGNIGYIGAPGMAEMFFSDAEFSYIKEIPFTMGRRDSISFIFEDAVEASLGFDFIFDFNPWSSAELVSFSKHFGSHRYLSVNDDSGILPGKWGAFHASEFSFRVPSIISDGLIIDEFSSLPKFGDLFNHRSKQIMDLIIEDYKLLCVHTATRNKKEWDIVKFKIVIDEFLDLHDDYAVIVVDPNDRGLDGGRHESRIFSLNGVDISTCSLIVSRCDAFLGVDSYFLHVADFSRIPSVGLFGPTDPSVWGFRFTRHFHISKPSMDEITVDEVSAALQMLLSR